MKSTNPFKRILSALLVFAMVLTLMPAHAHAAEADASLTAALEEAKSYIDGLTINNSSNDPEKVVKTFKTHFTWDNEKRENSKSYLFDWSYYNGVVFEGIEYLYEVTGESAYKDYVVEYMSALINENGGWATCTNNTSKQCAGYDATHGADCYKTASLLLDTYEMTGDSRYLTMAATLYADLDAAAKSYSLANAGNNYRHTWATNPTPDLWLDGLYMILPFRAEYAKYIGDTEELDLIVDRMQWVSDNMYNSSKGLFYHAADSASSNSGTYWLRSIGWYAAAIVDIMDSMDGENLEAMKKQLVKLVDGMKACQNASNGMWLNNMNASQSSSNPYETSGTALVCYAVMKAVNNGWLDESYADMAILAFNGICNEKLSGSNLTDICFKGAPGSSNSTFYDNEGKGVGPFIMFYAEVLEYVNTEEEVPEPTVPEETEVTEPEETEPEETEPEETVPGEDPVYQGTGNLESDYVYTLDNDGINSGEKYLIVYSGRALENNNGVDNNPTVSISSNTITLSDDSALAWTITQSSGSNYYVENNGSYINLSSSGTDPIGSSKTVYITGSSTYKFRNASGSGAYLRYSNSQQWCAGTSSSNNSMYLYRCTGSGTGEEVVFTATPVSTTINPGDSVTLSITVTVGGKTVNLSNCTINWASSNDACATVSAGTVTGVAGGDANITATLSAVNGAALKENIVLTIPIAVQGHTYESVTVAPTCTEGGYTLYTCTDCGDSYTDSYTEALGHDYETVTVEATCTEDGSVTTTCTVCGDSDVEVIPATGHDYEAVVTAPTCTEGGYTTHTCEHCGDSYTDSYIEALGHDYEAVVTAPTCIENGYTTYTCGTCGHSYTADEVATLGHDYESVTVDATCTEDGSITYTCDCGETYTEVIPAAGHVYETVTVNATCENDGSVTTTCTVCGETTVEVIPALGHSYNAVVTAPTCTEEGYTTYTCGTCGHSYTDGIVAALGHTYESVTVDATCATDGYTTYTCACGDTYTVVIPATGEHVYVAETVDATCTENGSVTYTCDCGHSYSEVIAATGHDHEAVVTAPTCTEAGYTTYTCACGDSYTADEVAALGHAYESVVTAPTCTEAGYTTYTCACGDSYTADEVAALGHDYEAVVTAPTCTEAGYTTYTCACGDTYVADEVAALGHDHEAVVTAPTCTEAGYTTYTCGTCGHTYVADETAALGHDYESVVTEATCTEAGYTTHTCGVCGDVTVDSHVDALGHHYETVITEATCTEAGSVVRTCATCGDSDAQIIPAIGHDYETVTVEATCTTDGSVTTTCGNCGETTVEVIPALGHEYQAVVTAPTCTEAGYTTYTCACGDTYVADEVAALGHDHEAVVTAPTCTEAGYTTYICTTCGDTYVADEVAALGHDHEAVVTAPTCTEGGYTTYTCACGDTYVADETAALGHSYTTEEVDGYLIYTCGHCGDTYSESIGWIAVSGSYVLDTDGIEIGSEHKYIVVGVDKDYALTLSGSTIGSAKVTVNGNTVTLDDASAYEFYFVNNSSKESGSYLLTQDGTKGVYHMGGNMYYGTDNKGYWHIGSASNGSYQLYDYDNQNWYLNYGYVWSRDSVSRFAVSSTARYVRLFKAVDGYVRLFGETNQTWIHGANTTEDAVLEKVLIQTSTDGSNVSGAVAVTADMISWDKTFDGYTAGTYTATVTYNGEAIGTITVTVTGEHIYETAVVAPTCTESGYTTHTCTECGQSYQSDVTAALGHSYTTEEVDGYLVYTCGNCGDSYSEKIASEFTYTRVSSISSGNNYVITLYSGRKYYALSHEGNSISVVQVTVSNGEITSEITEDLLWSYSNSKLSYESNGTTYYMYCYTNNWWGGWWGSNGTTLSLSTTNSSTVSFSSNRLKVGSYYLRYSNGSVSLNSSASTTYIFVESEE